MEKANLDAAVDAVDAVCVGNEIIQKGIADHDRLVREVDEARERFGRPVTTGFQPPDWQFFPDLATAVGDFSFLNVHPWWVLHRNDPLTAANWVAEAYQLVARTPGIPADRVVTVQETSFPSGAVPPEAAPGATPENQKRFYEALLATDVPFVWFLSVDSPKHARPPRPEGSEACGTKAGRPSPSSSSSPRPCRQRLAAIARAPVDAPGRARSAPVERDLARAKSGEVVVEVLVRRLDYVVERLACSATAQAQLLVQGEHAGRGAADGEHALGHVEIEGVERGHAPTEVPRVAADVLDREIDCKRRGPISRQLEPARREDEVLGTVGGLKRVVRRREARNRHSHAALDGQLRVGVQRDVLAAGRVRQARRAPARIVEAGPPELVVGDEAIAGGGRGLRLRRHRSTIFQYESLRAIFPRGTRTDRIPEPPRARRTCRFR